MELNNFHKFKTFILYSLLALSMSLLGFIDTDCTNTTKDYDEDDVNSLIVKLGSMDNDVRIEALRKIAGYGEEALPALTEAVKSDNQNVYYYSLRALGNIGEAAIPVLIDAHVSADAWDMRHVLFAVMHIRGDMSRPLIEAMDSEDEDVRRCAYTFVMTLEADSKELIAKLVEAVRNETYPLSTFPGTALANMGEEGLLKLTSLFKDENKDVRLSAISAIIYPDFHGLTAADAILELLITESDVEIQSWAARVLNNIQPSALKGLENIFTERHDDPDRQVRKSVARALGYFDLAPEIVRILLKMKDDEDEFVRGEAISSLGHANPADSDVIDALIGALNDETAWVRRDAAYSLGNMNPLPEVIKALSKTLHDSVTPVMEMAAISLGGFGADAESAVDDLAEALQVEEALTIYGPSVPVNMPVKQWRFSDALGEIGPAAEAAVPFLLDALENDYGELRISAAEALHKIDPEATNVVDFLIGELDAYHPMIRATAVGVLGDLGAIAEPALPKLRKMAELDYEEEICLSHVEEFSRQAILDIEAAIEAKE